MTVTAKSRFSAADAEHLYHLPAWGKDYFHIKGGKLCVQLPGTAPVALEDILADLSAKGRSLPLILRFPQIIEDRLDKLNGAFAKAIDESGYIGTYQGVYPVKVNQRRVVVETIAEYGAKYRTGLEAGSKAELALILVQDVHPDALICCNGFKDDDFIRLALWGRRLGKNVVVTLEKYSELDRVLRVAKEMGVRPAIGVRFKLHAKGSGKWESSGGDDAKFGLTASELINAAEQLKNLGLADALELLHCHVGSQLTDIRNIKVATREAARAYAELHKLGVGVKYLDLGGGLAVDYDGSKTTFYVSANYGLQEYADTLVWTVLEACEQADAPHPTIVTESGRALTAHHAVFCLDVIDATGPTRSRLELPKPSDPSAEHDLIRDLRELLGNVTVKTYQEVFNEAASIKATMHSLFELGYLGLLERAHIETLHNEILGRVAAVVKGLEYIPDEFTALPRSLADKYVGNFSLFQALPDHWAIGALFPIMPLHRLDEPPTRDATLVDISCDSDGKIETFIDLRDVGKTLKVHELTGEPYHLGVFLAGAYQDVLANAHNLFGRVNEAHIRLTEDGYTVELFVNGQKAQRVIENMGYEAPQLRTWLEEVISEADANLSKAEREALLRLYDAELVGYTYLEALRTVPG